MKSTKRKDPPKTARLAFRFSGELLRALDAEAERQGVSRTQLVETYCKVGLDEGIEIKVITRRGAGRPRLEQPTVFE